MTDTPKISLSYERRIGSYCDCCGRLCVITYYAPYEGTVCSWCALDSGTINQAQLDLDLAELGLKLDAGLSRDVVVSRRHKEKEGLMPNVKHQMLPVPGSRHTTVDRTVSDRLCPCNDCGVEHRILYRRCAERRLRCPECAHDAELITTARRNLDIKEIRPKPHA